MKALVAVGVAAVAVSPGCSRNPYDKNVPFGCEAHPTAYVRALDRAPGAVRINDVRISECLVKDADVGDVQRVGTTLVETARMLAEREDAEPLGYLVGAAQRGSDRTQGIHGEIVRRLEQEAGGLARTPPYERGLRAGRRSG